MANSMTSSHDKALSAKEKHKKSQSSARKYFRDKGYTTVKEKSYFEHGQQARKNIRENMKEGSNMHKYLGSKSHEVEMFRKRNNPFPKAK